MTSVHALDEDARRCRHLRRAGLVVMVTVVVGTLYAQLAGPVTVPTLLRSGDTMALLSGAEVAHDCLRRGELHACGRPADPLIVHSFEAPTSRVERFSPLLYLPAVAVEAAGLGRNVALWVIGALNAVAFMFMVTIPWLVRERLPRLYRHRMVWAPVIVCSPLLPYAVSTWSEPLAAALVVAAVAGVAARWPAWVVAVLALGAGISKDTMPPFVVLLAFAVAGIGSSVSMRTRLRSVVPVVVGSSLAVVAGALFNLFRYGTIDNVNYLAPFFRVRAPSNVLRQAVTIVLSPNGGLFLYWPLLLAPLVIAFMALRPATRDTRARIAVVALALVGFIALLAMWFSPFGWHAWGPRLMLPVIPGVVLALLLTSDRLPPLGRYGWAAVIVAGALSIPNVAVLTAQQEVTRFMTAPVPCTTGTSPVHDPFVACTMRQAWGGPWLLPRVLGGLRDPRTGALAVVYVSAVVVFAVYGRRTEVHAR